MSNQLAQYTLADTAEDFIVDASAETSERVCRLTVVSDEECYRVTDFDRNSAGRERIGYVNHELIHADASDLTVFAASDRYIASFAASLESVGISCSNRCRNDGFFRLIFRSVADFFACPYDMNVRYGRLKLHDRLESFVN